MVERKRGKKMTKKKFLFFVVFTRARRRCRECDGHHELTMNVHRRAKIERKDDVLVTSWAIWVPRA